MPPKISFLLIEVVRHLCRIPKDVSIDRFDTALSQAQTGDLIVSFRQLLCLQFPIHPLFNQFFAFLQLRPNQCDPNTFRILSSFRALNVVKSKLLKEAPLDLNYLWSIYSLVFMKKDRGHFHLQVRKYSSFVTFFTNLLDTEKNWA